MTLNEAALIAAARQKASTPNLIPPLLFKYFKPDRLDVLTSGRLRISQRQAVNDDDDFRPTYQSVAPDNIIAPYLEAEAEKHAPPELRTRIVHHILGNFQQEMLDVVIGAIKTPDLIGMVSMTDRPLNDRMWAEYAANSTGFVVAFNVRDFAGDYVPRLLVRRVAYTDEPLPYVVDGIETLASFYTKKTRWAYEYEWRGTALLRRYPVDGVDAKGLPVHFYSLPPRSVHSIVVRPTCTISAELRHLVAIDGRYSDVIIHEVP